MISYPWEFSTGSPNVTGRAVNPFAAAHDASDPPRERYCQCGEIPIAAQRSSSSSPSAASMAA